MSNNEKIAHLTGQVIALTLYVRALIDTHPRARDALVMADSEIESMIASLLAKPVPDGTVIGIEHTRQMVSPAQADQDT